MDEERMIAFGDFLGALIDVTAQIAYTIKGCQEIIATSNDEEEIAKAKKKYEAAKKAQEGIKQYSALKDNPLYKPIFKHYGLDRLNETMVTLVTVKNSNVN